MFESGVRKVKSPETGPSFWKPRSKTPKRAEFRIAGFIFSVLTSVDRLTDDGARHAGRPSRTTSHRLFQGMFAKANRKLIRKLEREGKHERARQIRRINWSRKAVKSTT